jgi:hypothetical protein
MFPPYLLPRENSPLTTQPGFYIAADTLTDGSLFARSLQRSPRHVWNDMPGSIQQSDIRCLHELVDINNFENTLVLTISHMLAFLGGGNFGC